MIQHPVHGLLPQLLRVGRAGQVSGVRPEQVMERIPARRVLGDQVRVGQLGHRRRRLPGGIAARLAAAGIVAFRAGVQAEQPEQLDGRTR